MSERVSIALAVVLHLGMIILFSRLTFEVQEAVPPARPMDIEFRGVQYADDDPRLALAEAPKASAELDGGPAAQDVIADTSESAAAQPSDAEALPEPLPKSEAVPEKLAEQEPVPTPKLAPETLAVAEPRTAPIPTPEPLAVSEPTPVPTQLPAAEEAPLLASAPVPQSILPPTQSPLPTKPARAVSTLAEALPQLRARTRPRLSATVLSGLRDAAGSETRQSGLNAATIGTAIGRAAPRGLPGLTIRQKTDLAQKVREQVMPCWKPPASDAPIDATIRLRFRLDRKGGVVGLPVQSGVTGPAGPNTAYLGLLATSGRRAILMCAPLKLPADLYEAWAEVEVEFDPRDLR